MGIQKAYSDSECEMVLSSIYYFFFQRINILFYDAYLLSYQELDEKIDTIIIL